MTNYDNFAHTFSKSRQDHPWPELDYIISDIYKQGYTSVLDVGCGNGRFLEQMERGTWNVRRYLWVDNSAGMIEEARRLHPEYRFEVCDMLSLFRHREGWSDPVSWKQSMDCFTPRVLPMLRKGARPRNDAYQSTERISKEKVCMRKISLKLHDISSSGVNPTGSALISRNISLIRSRYLAMVKRSRWTLESRLRSSWIISDEKYLEKKYNFPLLLRSLSL